MADEKVVRRGGFTAFNQPFLFFLYLDSALLFFSLSPFYQQGTLK